MGYFKKAADAIENAWHRLKGTRTPADETPSMESRVKELIKDLKGPRWRASYSDLVNMGKSAVPALIEAMDNKNSGVRCDIAWILGKIGDASAVPALVIALKGSRGLQDTAVWGLGHILENCKTIKDLEVYERGLDEGLARLQKRFGNDELVEIGFQIAKWKQGVAARKNELASRRDLILEDIPKPPPKKKGRMYQQLGRATHGR